MTRRFLNFQRILFRRMYHFCFILCFFFILPPPVFHDCRYIYILSFCCFFHAGHFIEIELEKHRYVNFDIYPSSRSVPIRRRRILPVRCCPARSMVVTLDSSSFFISLFLSFSPRYFWQGNRHLANSRQTRFYRFTRPS